ncbi:hypothetical protein C8Q77DRAFT_586740 [Trametes polyzona]|nr:hypothetical protein C8Q77DRAFT_586740 [Trametes polyzona]
MSAMVALQPIQPSLPPRLYASHVGSRRVLATSDLGPWMHNPASWNGTYLHINGELYRGMDCVPYVSKTHSSTHRTPLHSVALSTLGGDILDPSEVPQRRPSPIGSRRRHTRSPSPGLAPVSQHRVPPSSGDVLYEVRGARKPTVAVHVPLRPSSAPPDLQRSRPPLAPLQEEDERRAEGPDSPAPPVPRTADAKGVKHSQVDCAGDPLCATHRKRPSGRRVGPHTRKPLALWANRPSFGKAQCNDAECTSRHCADCAYLRNRGGALWTQTVRPLIEDRLEEIDLSTPTSEYAEDMLALLRFRATFQVRRTMA